MQVTPEALSAIYNNFRVLFKGALEETEVNWPKVAMLVPSTTSQETYAWLKEMPGLREWIGDRLVKSIAADGYTITNKRWEASIGVNKDRIEDEQLGIYSNFVAELARAAKTHPDELIFSLLLSGFTALCHDGQYFFDTDHPVDPEDSSKGTWSNFGGGSGTAWFLLDVSRAVKPLIFQRRKDIELVAMDQPTAENVFMRGEYYYGVDGRHNVGFGFPQLAYASKDTLNATNYAAARSAMRSLKNAEGRPLNILGMGQPLLVVPPSLEAAALEILNAERDAAGATNVWKGTADHHVNGWLAAA